MATKPAAANDAPESAVMPDSALAALLAQHEARAVGYYNSEIADEQARAINYYYGVMDDLPVLDGCSSVVDHTVAIMVDNGLASVLKPFVSADEVVSFEPRGPEDVEQAEQATEYVNYVINCDNPGFIIFHDWFKDALLTKIGVVKTWWEDSSRQSVKPMLVGPEQLLAIRQAPQYLDEQDNGDGSFTVLVQEEEQDGRVKVVNVPPEEFLISPFARSIEEAAYVAHRPSNYTRSDLVEMGMDVEIVEGLPAYASGKNEESRSQARYRDEEWYSGGRDSAGSDKSRDIIAVLDEYVKVDYDGDGIAELRRVVRVSDKILINETVDEIPFALICPAPMPHKVYGRSTADQSMEGQKVLTAITRQTLDNLYKSNNPRPVISEDNFGKSTGDDLLDSSPGAVIRPKRAGEMSWSVVPFSADKSFAMMEALAQNVEERTGIQRKGNGFNAEALKKNSQDTATAAAIDENSRNERAEMIARIFAETGVKRLFKLILGLLVAHQPKARIVKLRNKFVEMDPSGWNPEMDLSISVGLGMGNKSEQMAQAQTVLQTMSEIAVSPFAHLVNSEKAYNALKRLYTAAGIKNVDDFIVEPKKDEQGNVVEPEKQPDPQTMKVQADIQANQAKLQMEQQSSQQKASLAEQEAGLKLQLAREEGAAKIQLQREEAALQAQLAQQKAMFEAELANRKFEAERAMAERQMAMQEQLAARDAERRDFESDRKAAAMEKNRPGGKLDE